MLASSAFKYDVFLLTKTAIEIKDQNTSISIEDNLKGLLSNNFGYFPLTNQLKKIAELILVTVNLI